MTARDLRQTPHKGWGIVLNLQGEGTNKLDADSCLQFRIRRDSSSSNCPECAGKKISEHRRDANDNLLGYGNIVIRVGTSVVDVGRGIACTCS